jgi:hypothetical protein
MLPQGCCSADTPAAGMLMNSRCCGAIRQKGNAYTREGSVTCCGTGNNPLTTTLTTLIISVLQNSVFPQHIFLNISV